MNKAVINYQVVYITYFTDLTMHMNIAKFNSKKCDLCFKKGIKRKKKSLFQVEVVLERSTWVEKKNGIHLEPLSS